MERHFHEELRTLKEELLRMALLVRDAVTKATNAAIEQNLELAESVIQEDRFVNEMEIKIDDTAHSLLTLRQPMAVDMRLLTMILKINNDLERIGDHAVNIAEKVKLIHQEGLVSEVNPVTDLCPIKHMADLVTQVLVDAVDAFLKKDAGIATDLLKRDDAIDELYKTAARDLEDHMRGAPDRIPTCVALIMISHDLERIGDLANNIAEDAIYLIKGKEVRHHHETTP